MRVSRFLGLAVVLALVGYAAPALADCGAKHTDTASKASPCSGSAGCCPKSAAKATMMERSTSPASLPVITLEVSAFDFFMIYKFYF